MVGRVLGNMGGFRFIFVALGQTLLMAVCSTLACAALRPLKSGRTLLQIFSLCLPLAAVATGAYIADGIGLTLTLIIASAVGSLLLVMGFAILATPHGEKDTPGVNSPAAALVMPLALLLLLGGFSGHSGTGAMIALAVCALVALNLVKTASPVQTAQARPSGFKMLAFVSLSITFATAAGYTGYRLTQSAQSEPLPFSADALAILLICPVILFPLLARAVHYSSSGDLSITATLTAGFTHVCVGILTPLVITIDYLLRLRQDDLPQLAAIPPISWRLDSSLLLCAGFALLGLRFGLLRPSRWLALLLMTLYLAYLLIGTVLRIQ